MVIQEELSGLDTLLKRMRQWMLTSRCCRVQLQTKPFYQELRYNSYEYTC